MYMFVTKVGQPQEAYNNSLCAVTKAVFNIFIFSLKPLVDGASYYAIIFLNVCLNQIDTPPAVFFAEFQKP